MNLKVLFTTYRYIIKETISPFLIGVFFITFILIMFQVLRLTDFVIVHGVDYKSILKLIYYLIVAFLPISIPVSFLFSILLVFSNFSSNSEIVAFKSAGISVWQILLPVLFFSTFVAFITFYVSFYEGPWGNRSFEQGLRNIGTNKAITGIQEGYFNTKLIKNFTLYAQKANTKENTMQEVFIHDERNKKAPSIIVAKHSKLDIDPATKRSIMSFHEGTMSFLNQKQNKKYRAASFKKYSVLLYPGKNVRLRKPNLPSMTHQELNIKIRQAKESNNNSRFNKLTVELHRRVAIPIACFIFGLFGVIFSSTGGRNSKASASIISFVTMLSYWVLYIAGTAVGIKGVINPVLSVWMANIIFATISMYILLFKRAI